MKPTHIITNERSTNEPAIYFRPTFDITGSMLQYCIAHFLDRDPEARINLETVKAEMHRQLQESGYSRLIPDELNWVDVDIMHTAEHFANVLYPEFFGITAAEALEKFGPMPEYHLKHVKKAPAQPENTPEAEPEEENSITSMAAEAAQLNGNGTEKPARSGRGRPRKNP